MISACVIAFNEEAKIEECLRSVQGLCGEVIVVDSHSTDRTRELAAALGARVVERDWPGHIDQKNFAIEQATGDWVLCLDADERVTPELRAAIERALAAPAADGYTVNRRNIYLGRWIRGGGWYPDRKLRLVRRAASPRWGGVNPHDHLEVQGRTADLGADLVHLSYDSIADHLKTIDYFSTIAAREKLSRGQRWIGLHLVFGPPLKFFKMFILQRALLDGWRGLIVAGLGAFYVLLRYAKLWELVHVQERALGTGERVTYGTKAP